jgi:hypothetical protein
MDPSQNAAIANDAQIDSQVDTIAHEITSDTSPGLAALAGYKAGVQGLSLSNAENQNSSAFASNATAFGAGYAVGYAAHAAGVGGSNGGGAGNH